jgi:DNA invertase Pin-like site-specific DNA recombinase
LLALNTQLHYMNPSKLQLQPKTQQQIAEEYGIHRNTLQRRLRKEGIELPNGVILPTDVKKIYDALGWPEKYNKGN